MNTDNSLLGMAYGTATGGAFGVVVFTIQMIVTLDPKWAVWAVVHFAIMATGVFIARRVRAWL